MATEQIASLFGPEFLLKLYLGGALGGSVFYLAHKAFMVPSSKVTCIAAIMTHIAQHDILRSFRWFYLSFPYGLLIISTNLVKVYWWYIQGYRGWDESRIPALVCVNSSQDIQNMLHIHLAKCWIYIFSVFMHLWVPTIFWTSVVKPFHHI